MELNVYRLPIQTKTLVEKEDDDFKWAKDTIKAWIQVADFNHKDYDEMDRLLLAVEGKIFEEDYKQLLNPFNTDNPQFKKFPAKLKSFPLIMPVIQSFLGETLNRFKIEQVVAVNADVDNELKTRINLEIEVYYKQKMINSMNALGIDTGVDSKEIDIKSIVDDIVETFDDKLSIQGQEILDYIYYNLDLDDVWQEAAYYWYVLGRVCTYKYVKDDEVYMECKDPRDVWFANNNVTYNENSDAAVCKLRYTKTQLISKHYNTIKNDESILKRIEDLDNADALREFNAIVFNDGETFIHKSREEDDSNYLIGYHVQWKAFQLEGELTHYDIEGQIINTVVDESYKFDKTKGDININWYWTEETWEGEMYGDMFFDVRPALIQRNQINNRSSSKLGYNGRRVLSKTSGISSIAKTGYPFQMLANTLYYQLETTINKNKDKILLMPLGLIPDKPGWSIDKFMYMATSLSFAFFDESKDNAAAVISSIKSIDMGLGQYIKDMYDLINAVKQEFWDAIGMNRQRFGDVNSSDGKGVNEQALFRSALISAELFRQIDKFKEKDANGLIDCAKVAYINGKKGTYVTSDGLHKTIEVTGEEICWTEYGIFSKNNFKEDDKKNTLKSMGLTMLQNESDISTFIDVLDNDNFSKIKRIVKKADKAKRAFIAQQEAAKQEAEQTKLANEAKAVSDKLELEKYKADRNYDAVVDAATIAAGLQVENAAIENEMSKEELALRREEIAAGREDLKAKVQMNRENNASKEKIAASKPKPTSKK